MLEHTMERAKRRTAYIHIGLHKTGTTSLQNYCVAHRGELEQNGLRFYLPLYYPSSGNANELASLILRPGVWNGYANHLGLDGGTEKEREARYKENVLAHFKEFLSSEDNSNILVSGEHISFLRSEAELTALLDLFRGHNLDLHIICMMRDVDDWWRSYRNQTKKRARVSSPTYNSMDLLDRDGWLCDFQTLKTVLDQSSAKTSLLTYSDRSVEDILETCGIFEIDVSCIGSLNQSISPTGILFIQSRILITSLYSRYIARTWAGQLKRKIFAISIFEKKKKGEK